MRRLLSDFLGGATEVPPLVRTDLAQGANDAAVRLHRLRVVALIRARRAQSLQEALWTGCSEVADLLEAFSAEGEALFRTVTAYLAKYDPVPPHPPTAGHAISLDDSRLSELKAALIASRLGSAPVPSSHSSSRRNPSTPTGGSITQGTRTQRRPGTSLTRRMNSASAARRWASTG